MHLQRSIPEIQGVPSKSIISFLDSIKREKIELHSLMLVRNGNIIAEGAWSPYDLNKKHEMFSITKSITSTAVGFAIEENILSLDDKVVSFFPEYSDLDMDEKMSTMTVRHLLTMTSGYIENIPGSTELSQIEGSWVKEFLELPLTYEPGTKFVYNSASSHILSAIVSKVTKQNLSEYLEPRLFGPLNIKGYTWDTDLEGNNTGGWGMRLKTEDVAKFGQFYLQKGIWEGKQLLSQDYIEQASSFQVSSTHHSDDVDTQQGYGFQFWRSRYGAYRAVGMFGQICIVLPQQNAVFVVTSGTERKQEILDIFWKTVYPNFISGKLTESTQEKKYLEMRLNNLTLFPKQPHSSSPKENKVSGKQYRMKANADNVHFVEFNFSYNSCLFKLVDNTGEHQIECGLESWIEQKTTMPGATLHLLQQPADLPVKARGFWKDETTFVMTWTFFQMSFTDTITCCFEGHQLILMRSVNDHGPYPAERPTIIGKIN
ncbi:serine hydrolase domain-containing protein [Virgibacillus oceani]